MWKMEGETYTRNILLLEFLLLFIYGLSASKAQTVLLLEFVLVSILGRSYAIRNQLQDLTLSARESL